MTAPQEPIREAVYRYSLRRRKVRELRDADVVASPVDADRFARAIKLDQTEQEHLIVLMLNVRNRVLGYCLVTVGLVDRTQSHAREVFRGAILLGSVRILLIHNHPSGDASPSQGDVRITRELAEAGKIVGIEVVDHVITGDPTLKPPGYASLRELGYL